MSERVLKLSLPTLYFWLSMFYVLFHLWLNIAAELTTFADREFYKVGALGPDDWQVPVGRHTPCSVHRGAYCVTRVVRHTLVSIVSRLPEVGRRTCSLVYLSTTQK